MGKVMGDQGGRGVGTSHSAFAAGSAFRGGERREEVTWHLAEETPVAFVYNTEPHAVMMATPADLEDFALGFSIAEQVVAHPKAFLTVRVEEEGVGRRLCIAVDPDELGPGALTERTLAGGSGCGLCGLAEIGQALRPLPPVPGLKRVVLAEAIVQAYEAFRDHQPMNRLNHSVHGAAFCDPEGRILLCREDVGRHNALDKVIGAMARAGFDPSEGFVLLSSRCGAELVQKAAAAGISLLATLSAPTALAVDLARGVGLTLAARNRSGGVILFQ
ncbi:formate dehydrogenase accessory sulfurtransferase FdhD [Rhodospirillum sp. A1_3_36]|uniref:formate dehydrogenase accessory sulfurtransferase FdhD n=1 Tax=Rhodospirillum sp. A1_3_36 TaxID=3391666 RepID=UPI0039A742C9